MLFVKVSLVIIILLLVFMSHMAYKAQSEKLSLPQNAGYVGYPYAYMPLPYDSGADLRELGVRFSQPSQGADKFLVRK